MVRTASGSVVVSKMKRTLDCMRELCHLSGLFNIFTPYWTAKLAVKSECADCWLSADWSVFQSQSCLFVIYVLRMTLYSFQYCSAWKACEVY